MVEPISASLIATTCALGMVKGLSGKAATAVLTRLLEALQASHTPEGDEVLKATHAAFVRSIQLMAEACSITGGEASDRFSAEALAKLATDTDFVNFRAALSVLPAEHLKDSIRAVFDSGDPNANAAEFVIASVEDRIGQALTESHRELFRQGSEKHRSWSDAFQLFFAEQVQSKEKVFRSLTFHRANEIIAFAEAHNDDIVRLHERLSAVGSELHVRFDRADRHNQGVRESLARMEVMLAEQTGVPLPTLREIAREFGELQPGADAAVIEAYLRQKASEYHLYRERSESLQIRDNYGRMLLAQALEAIDTGHFDKADQLISEAEDYDEEISRELRISADQRDIDRSNKRSLRGDAAKLSGDYLLAISHYDAAAEMLPANRVHQYVHRKWAAASAAHEWGDRADPDLLRTAIVRWKELTTQITEDQMSELWAELQSCLGSSLACLAERTHDLALITESVNAFRSSLRVRTLEKDPDLWAMTQNNLANALQVLGERSEDPNLWGEAVSAYRAALQIRTVEKDPIRYAMTQNNLGTALKRIGELSGNGAVLREAIIAIEEAVQYYPSQDRPLDWASAKNNLATIYGIIGEQEADSYSLRRAAAEFRQVLTIYERTSAPMDWAMAQHNLGNCLRLLGESESDIESLNCAVSAYDAALGIFQSTLFPIDWALSTNSLGRTYYTIAKILDDASFAHLAAEKYAKAHEVFGRAGLPRLTAMAHQEGQNAAALATALIKRKQ